MPTYKYSSSHPVHFLFYYSSLLLSSNFQGWCVELGTKAMFFLWATVISPSFSPQCSLTPIVPLPPGTFSPTHTPRNCSYPLTRDQSMSFQFFYPFVAFDPVFHFLLKKSVTLASPTSWYHMSLCFPRYLPSITCVCFLNKLTIHVQHML